MKKTIIISKLKKICNNKYKEKSSLISLYRDILEHNNFIRKNTSEILWQDLCIELDYVYNEFYFGNSLYSDNIFKQCINILEKIIEEIK